MNSGVSFFCLGNSAAFAVAVAFSMSAAAEPTLIDGNVIRDVIPEGYCAIGDSAKRSAMTQMARGFTKDNGIVISVFESCVRKPPSPSSVQKSNYRFGFVVVSKTFVADGTTRAQYLEGAESFMRKQFPSPPQRPDQRLSAAKTSKVPINENLGVVGRDSNAVYQSAIGTLKTEGDNVMLGVSVVGNTFVRGRSFSNFLYEIVNVNTTVAGLLVEQQQVMSAFIKDNE